MIVSEDIAELVQANHILAAHGVVDGFGHVSVRADATRFFLARSMAPALVRPADILEFDLGGEIVGARTAAPYLERFIHAEIYRARPDVLAVVHSHSPAVIPFGVTPAPLRAIFHMSAFMGAAVPVFDTRDTVGDSDLLIRNGALGQALAERMAGANAVLQRGHGSTVVGTSLRQAVFRAVYLEINARLQGAAMALGPVTYLTPGEAALATASVETAIDRAWDLWTRATPATGGSQ